MPDRSLVKTIPNRPTRCRSRPRRRCVRPCASSLARQKGYSPNQTHPMGSSTRRQRLILASTVRRSTSLAPPNHRYPMPSLSYRPVSVSGPSLAAVEAAVEKSPPMSPAALALDALLAEAGSRRSPRTIVVDGGGRGGPSQDNPQHDPKARRGGRASGGGRDRRLRLITAAIYGG